MLWKCILFGISMAWQIPQNAWKRERKSDWVNFSVETLCARYSQSNIPVYLVLCFTRTKQKYSNPLYSRHQKHMWRTEERKLKLSDKLHPNIFRFILAKIQLVVGFLSDFDHIFRFFSKFRFVNSRLHHSDSPESFNYQVKRDGVEWFSV